METDFLRLIRVPEITQPEVESIEVKTQSQAKSDLWVGSALRGSLHLILGRSASLQREGTRRLLLSH